jgi:hypothetical protein
MISPETKNKEELWKAIEKFKNYMDLSNNEHTILRHFTENCNTCKEARGLPLNGIYSKQEFISNRYRKISKEDYHRAIDRLVELGYLTIKQKEIYLEKTNGEVVDRAGVYVVNVGVR